MDAKDEIFTAMEIDAIGEILNISLGSSATSVSGLLDRRVNITTPTVQVLTSGDFNFEEFEPAVGVEINYISGLSGTNVMILKESDVKAIVGLLLGSDYSDQEFVMDEMSISAICEVMNQMMGASSTALSQFLNRTVNISTPQSFMIEDANEFKKKYYTESEDIVSVSFHLIIEDIVDSEFISVLTIDLAKELVSLFSMGGDDDSISMLEPEPEPIPVAPPPQPVAQPQQQATQPVQQPMAQQPQPAPQPQQPAAYPPPGYPPQQQPYPGQPYPGQPAYAAAPPQGYAPPRQQRHHQYAPSNLKTPEYDSFDDDVYLTDDQNNNLNMIMTVPLQVTVEIGRTKKKIKEILEFNSGTIIELNKQAGTAVDIFVNGQAIAKGDVVVVDDYYGVRITEVSSNSEILKLL